ncbi:hypothetical protein BHAOGJBA_6045 [Methylobacterium hispanicum]|uniref:Uncharacterized protein n=1 Tax=Methylobacterium hispanicum TaxID=270350 RepID=A0AAV4ZX38_9HYPH|nr:MULTISPECIES: hypothetical protein [Methylobacterium]GJD92491.1 hypothetical protein BHAOGJBA_6045 [Methylobacterium hispanicum]
MSAPRALRGELDDIRFDWPRGLLVAHVVLPWHEFDSFTRGVGTPGNAVAVLACTAPTYPDTDTDADALAIAELEALSALLGEGKVRATPAFLDRLGRLMAAANRQVLPQADPAPPE